MSTKFYHVYTQQMQRNNSFLTEPTEKFSLTTLQQHLAITLGPVIMQIYKLADALLITPYDVPYNGIHVLMSKYNNKKEYSTEE